MTVLLDLLIVFVDSGRLHHALLRSDVHYDVLLALLLVRVDHTCVHHMISSQHENNGWCLSMHAFMCLMLMFSLIMQQSLRQFP